MAGASPATAVDAAYRHAADVVRAQDGDRYVADLFVPEPWRKHVFALHAFNVEVSRIRDVVSDPTLGEIRLQWWRDAVLAGTGGGNPIATALVDTISRFSLPLPAFERLLDARVFDLFNDPMPTLNDLEGYAGDTTSSLFQLAAIVIADGHDPGTATASGHAGVAFALIGLQRSLPRHVARRQCYLPAAMLASRDIDLETVFRREVTAALAGLLSDLRTVARQHVVEAERDLAHADPALRPAFLPLALVRPYLDRMDKASYDPFAGAELAPWRRQWIIWRAARAWNR